jgi:glycosyltransferase involved in cell wall biosynthesis
MQATSEAFPGKRIGGQASAISRKIRVLQIITVLGTGGATKVVLDIAGHFNRHPDFEIEILTGPIPADRTDQAHVARKQGIPTQTVPNLVNHISPVVNVKAMLDIRRIITQGGYDIVHTHSSVAGVVGRLAAHLAGTGVIVHHVHGWGIQEGMSSATQMLYLGLERLCAKFSDRIIVVSKPDIQKGQDHHIAKEDKLALIYNGIDLDAFREPVDEMQLRSELGLEPSCKLVGMIGRLDKQKNPLDFIRAAAIASKDYPEIQFLLIGDGPLQSECERLAGELGLSDKVFFLGFRDDVNRILPILTITAMSSLWEGLPITFLESMSAGKPIVANDVDGASDVVIDGETGYLVTPHQPQEMAERILYLLTNEKQCNKMGQVAKDRSSAFSKQRMVGQIESLYKELYVSAHQSPNL